MSNRKTVKYINENADTIVAKASLTADNIQKESNYHSMMENLRQQLSLFGMDVKIHLYGSRIIGLANDESDLDIFVEHGSNFYAEKDVTRDRSLLERMAVAIENGGLWMMKCKILSASVPILQVIYKPMNLKCDISVSNGIGVKNSLILRYLFELQPETKKFYYFIKIFLQRYNGSYEGYLVKLLVIFFFQSEKILPSIRRVQESLAASTISNWQVQLDESRTASYYDLFPIDNYKSFIPKFFYFYGEFNYLKNVISIHHGLPVARKVYKYQDETEDHLLCVFGPINLKHNIGKYVSQHDAKYFTLLTQSLGSEFTKHYSFKTKT